MTDVSIPVERKVRIKKAKIKDDLFLEVEYSEDLPGHSRKDVKETITIPVHDDMKEAFQRLHVHLALLCDETKLKKGEDVQQAVIPDFFVRGFSVSGNDENEGVTISGYKEGKYGTVNLNTPFTKYESDDYPHISELGLDMNQAVHEVELYLFEGKRAPERQLAMEFGEDDETLGAEETE